MAYTVFHRGQTFGPRKGLDGPFEYANGRVLYYDVKEGLYYDPLTDWYVENDEVSMLQAGILTLLAKV